MLGQTHGPTETHLEKAKGGPQLPPPQGCNEAPQHSHGVVSEKAKQGARIFIPVTCEPPHTLHRPHSICGDLVGHLAVYPSGSEGEHPLLLREWCQRKRRGGSGLAPLSAEVRRPPSPWCQWDHVTMKRQKLVEQFKNCVGHRYSRAAKEIYGTKCIH